MSKTHTMLPGSHPLDELIRKIALPLFLFAAVLMGLLILSWFLLVPAFTNIDIAGQNRTPQELRQYRAQLQEDLATLEKQRDAYVLPPRSPVYDSLLVFKQHDDAFVEYWEQLSAIARRIASGESDSVIFERVEWNSAESTLLLTGDVRMGARSMTALAQLVEDIRSLSFVTSVDASRFIRVDDAVLGAHSPFTLTVRL